MDKHFDLNDDGNICGLAVHLSDALDPEDRKKGLPLFDRLTKLITEWREQQRAHK